MADAATAAVFNQLSGYLKDLGLGQLFTVDAAGNPGGWLWNQIQSGIDSPDELRSRLEQTDVFRERFGVITEQQRRAAKGEPVLVMTPAQVIEYENRVKQMMSASGLPTTFYDEPKDFHRLILADMSPDEVQRRIAQAYDYVDAAPPEVRAKFNEFYGPGQGDAALAAWALDPDRTLNDINRATRTAYTAGMAKRFDIEIDRSAAERIAQLPQTEAGIVQGLETVARQSDILREGIGEATDITNEDAISAVFEGNADATRRINQRIGERRSVDKSSTGGAVISNTGVVGAGQS